MWAYLQNLQLPSLNGVHLLKPKAFWHLTSSIILQFLRSHSEVKAHFNAYYVDLAPRALSSEANLLVLHVILRKTNLPTDCQLLTISRSMRRRLT